MLTLFFFIAYGFLKAKLEKANRYLSNSGESVPGEWVEASTRKSMLQNASPHQSSTWHESMNSGALANWIECFAILLLLHNKRARPACAGNPQASWSCASPLFQRAKDASHVQAKAMDINHQQQAEEHQTFMQDGSQPKCLL